MAACNEKLYPNCDASVWLRSCEEEVTEPLEGQITGEIPTWVRGSLLRNGPGSLKVGSMRFDHLFDSSALLHRNYDLSNLGTKRSDYLQHLKDNKKEHDEIRRLQTTEEVWRIKDFGCVSVFAIHDGSATYQCRFLQSNTLKRNRAAQRIVVTEFGTSAVPDPCHTIFDRVAALFNPGESLSDNAMISLYPFGDEMYAFTEGPVIHRVDPVTLDTMERRNLADSLALVNHTSHPHVMPNGDVYNVGMSLVRGRLQHVVVKFPFIEKGDMFERAHVVGTMNPRWPLHPAYMHTFGVTEKYFVIVEQPLSVSLPGLVRNQLANRPLAASLQWYSQYETHIVLISRTTGKEVTRFRTDTLFYLHIINAYEQGGRLIVDLCAYNDAKMIDAMYIQAIETMQSNADYAEWFRGRPKRIEITLDSPRLTKFKPKLIADLGCETPRIHYDLHNGKPYRYFYAISSDVDIENPGLIIKVDTQTGEVKTWCDTLCYPSEPIFIPRPGAKREDDGVLVSSVVRGREDECCVALLVLDATSLQELARVTFRTPSQAPKCLHGWFLPERP